MFSLWNPESWVLESGIQLKESGIPLRIGIQNPCSTKKDWNTVPEIQNSLTSMGPYFTALSCLKRSYYCLSIIHDNLFNLSFGLFIFFLLEVSLKERITKRIVIIHNSENC